MKTNESNLMYVTGMTKSGQITSPLNVPELFDANNKVTFRYVIEKNKKSIVTINKEFTESELLRSAVTVNEILLELSEGKNTLLSVESRRFLNTVIELFSLRKFNLCLFKKMLKKLSKDNAARWMFDNKDEVLIKNAVNAKFYMYLFDKKENTNVCTIYDKEFDLDPILQISDQWKTQPITEIEGFKSKQEFIDWFKKTSHGTLETEWTNESSKEIIIH